MTARRSSTLAERTDNRHSQQAHGLFQPSGCITDASVKSAYRDALAALADDPASSALRQDPLSKGRALTAAGQRLNACAKTPRVSVHDELAIRNHLDAIHAGIPTPAAGIAEGLARFAALNREDILTPEELARLKQQIVGRSSGVEDVIRLPRGLKALKRDASIGGPSAMPIPQRGPHGVHLAPRRDSPGPDAHPPLLPVVITGDQGEPAPEAMSDTLERLTTEPLPRDPSSDRAVH